MTKKILVTGAAHTYIGESMTDPDKYFENDVIGGPNLFEASSKE